MMSRTAFVLVAIACAGLVAAQGPTLTATVNQSPHSVTLTVTGATAGPHVMLVASLTQGSYPVMMGVTLGVLPPFVIMDMGTADATGQVSRTYPLGPGLPTGTTAYAQSGVITMNMGSGGMGSGGMGTMMTILLTNVISFIL